MITWIRASFLHEDIKLIVIKELRVSIPRWHSRGTVRWLGVAPRRIRPVVPALVPALTSPLTDHTHSSTHRQIVAVVLLLQLSIKQLHVCLR